MKRSLALSTAFFSSQCRTIGSYLQHIVTFQASVSVTSDWSLVEVSM